MASWIGALVGLAAIALWARWRYRRAQAATVLGVLEAAAGVDDAPDAKEALWPLLPASLRDTPLPIVPALPSSRPTTAAIHRARPIAPGTAIPARAAPPRASRDAASMLGRQGNARGRFVGPAP